MTKWIIKLNNGNEIKVEADNIISAAGAIINSDDIFSITKAKKYSCQVCGESFDNYEEFRNHEAKCLGLSLFNYDSYINKKSWAGYTLRAYKNNPTEKNKNTYNIAVDSLHGFETYYNLPLSDFEKLD